MPNNVVHHEHIVGQWEPVNGQLRDKQRDAIDWFENTMPMKYVRTKHEGAYKNCVIYKIGRPVEEVKHPALGYRGDIEIYTDGHIEWHPGSPWSTSTARSFLNPIDAVTWLLMGVLQAELPSD